MSGNFILMLRRNLMLRTAQQWNRLIQMVVGSSFIQVNRWHIYAFGFQQFVRVDNIQYPFHVYDSQKLDKYFSLPNCSQRKLVDANPITSWAVGYNSGSNYVLNINHLLYSWKIKYHIFSLYESFCPVPRLFFLNRE